jgi:stearoyl-CoA desaturase (delta-9 desaturase)
MIYEVIYTLVMTHITMASVSIYLHRGLSHQTITFHLILGHFFRFWLWLTDGVVIKHWVAQHRKHHKYTDVTGDPHSPIIFGLKAIAWDGFLATIFNRYRFFDSDWVIENYSKNTPNDWIEKTVYTPYSKVGLFVMLGIDVLLFGWYGILIWIVQMVWIPFWSNSVVTGFCHWWGYQHKDCKDNSRNLFPIGIIMVGDELHSNHHAHPNNPNNKYRWFEFDLGYIYIRIFEKLGLLTINKRI